MGSASFWYQVPRGTHDTAQAAFTTLRDADRREYGSNYYSGTIGQKSEVRLLPAVDTLEEAFKVYESVIYDTTSVFDKNGPAACVPIRTGDHDFLIFGWAAE